MCYKINMSSSIAQSVEQVAVNHWVGGSSPSRGAIFQKNMCVIGIPIKKISVTSFSSQNNSRLHQLRTSRVSNTKKTRLYSDLYTQYATFKSPRLSKLCRFAAVAK